MSNYRITQKGREVNLRAKHNKETWGFVKSILLAYKVVSWEQLSKACCNHDHPAGGDAFIPYMAGSGWIERV